MPRRILERIRASISAGTWDMTQHAFEEMADDHLDLVDIESAILGGALSRTAKDDPRGARYTVLGTSVDGEREVTVVARFTETKRLLIVTVYASREEAS